MIKREFIENNLLKVLDYLPAHLKLNNNDYQLTIQKYYNGSYVVYYYDTISETLLYPSKDFNTLIDAIIYAITKLDKYIPNFINNLVNI